MSIEIICVCEIVVAHLKLTNKDRETCLSTVSFEQVSIIIIIIIIIGHTLDYNKLILCAVDSLIW